MRVLIVAALLIALSSVSGTTHEVGFLQTTYTVMEGEDAVITFGLLTDPTLLTANDFAVIDIEVVADTATSSVDYDSSGVASGFYFIAVGGATSSFTIPTTLDTKVEGNESFVVRLAFSQDVGYVAGDFAVRESNRQATVIILEPSGNEQQQLICFCDYNLSQLPCERYDNNTCTISTGQCVAEFTRVGDTVSKEYGCLTVDNLRVFDVRSGLFNTDNRFFGCCDNENQCNRQFITRNPFTTPPPIITEGGTEGSSMVVQIAVPISVVVLLMVVIVTIVIAIIIIRCRKKRMEQARRGDGVDNKVSCDLKVAFPLDEYTDPFGSGFSSIKLGESIGTERCGKVLLGDYQGEK